MFGNFFSQFFNWPGSHNDHGDHDDHNPHNPPPPPPPPPSNTYQFTALSGEDIINGNKNYLSIGASFVMPVAATTSITVTDNDPTLSGDNRHDEHADDHTQQTADIDYAGTQVQSDVEVYAEQTYYLHGSDGHIYKLVEIEITGVAQFGNDKVDYYAFDGAVPASGVSLTVIGVTETQGVHYNDLGAGPAAIEPIFGTGDTTGATAEIADNAPGENTATHTVTGTIDFQDNLGDTHTVSTAPEDSGYVGSFSAHVSDDSTTDGSGQVSWEFDVNDSAIDYLAAGQTLTEKYDVTIDDGHGGTDTETVTINIEGANDAPVYDQVTEFQQGFETDSAGIVDGTNGWYGAVSIMASGTNGIDAPDGGYYALLTQGGPTGDETGPFTRFDGYRADFTGDWTAEVKVYLDTSWALGEGFDYSVASDGSDGAHQRDFIFHVAKDTSTQQLIVAADNNTNFDPREDLDTLPNHYVVASSGWYTLQHVFHNDGGVLSVDLNLVDAMGNVVFTETREDTVNDTIDQIGGNRYGWFTNIDVSGGIAVDSYSLQVPDYQAPQIYETDGTPASGDMLTTSGDLPFGDVDLIDTHTASALLTSSSLSDGSAVSTALETELMTALSASIGTDSTGSGSGDVGWTFTLDASSAEFLAEGQVLTATYDVTVTDNHSTSDTVPVTVTIVGTNDVPVIGGDIAGSVTEDSDPTTLFTDGTLTIADVDNGESSFAPQASTAGDNGYGTFSLDAAGHWTYTASNANPAIQGLAVDETLTDSFTAVSSDGSANQLVTVTINGENDVVYSVNDTVDPSATDGGAGTELIVGSGIPADGFGIASQTDVGVELGLQVIYRQGPTVLSSDNYSDGELHFQVNDGAQSTFNGSQVDNAGRAAWSFDYSIATGLNGESGDLSSYTFKLLYDVDPTAGTNYHTLVLEPGGSGSSGYEWRDVDTNAVVIADDEGNSHVTQNSENYAFSFVQDYLTAPYGPGNGFAGPGQYDIVLEASRGSNVLASNHIVVDVDVAAPGEVVVLDSGGNAIYHSHSIQDAIDNTTADGQTILVGDGTYNENIVVDRPLTLLSEHGRDATTIAGISGVGALGSVLVQNGVDNVTIGGTDQGFHIVGIDNGIPGIENAAVYLQGSQAYFNLLDNEVEANGDHGMLSEYGGALTHALIDGNEFSGQTFLGSQPGGIGFGSQFTEANVPRQLVVIGEGGGGPYNSGDVTFTHNLLSGTTGGISSDDNVSEQGNTMVTIDVNGATISDNTFTGETARYATGLRARGPDTNIDHNTFDNSSGGDTRGVEVDNKGMPGTYDGNHFVGGPDADLFQGSPGDDHMTGAEGNDTFVGNLGNDTILGGADHDTSVYAGSSSDFSYTYDVDSHGLAVDFTSVTDNNASDGNEGADTLDSVESLAFLGDGHVLDAAQAVQLFDTSNILVGTYDTIQDAVDASAADYTIRLAAGTIDLAGAGDSQVEIDHNLNIVGSGMGASTIVPVADTATSGDARGMFLIDDGVNVDVSDLTVDGSGQAIYQAFRDYGSGTFDHVEFTNIAYSASGSPYAGAAIVAFGSASVVDVTNSDFSDIGREGVLYFGSGTSGTFEGNTYTGKGGGDFLDYAVEVGAGAHVDIIGNTITDNQGVAATDGSTSAGVLVTTYFGAGSEAHLMDNTFTDNTTGVAVGFDASDTSTVDLMTGNTVTGGTGAVVVGDAVVTNGVNFDGNFDWSGGANGNTMETGNQADVLRGGSGSDFLVGHGDGDVFVFGAAEANDGQTDMDIIQDFGNGNDEIHLTDGLTAASVLDDGFGNTTITLNGTDADVIHVLGASATDVTDHLFVV